MRHVKEDHWGHAQRSSRFYKSAPAHLFPRTSSAEADALARTRTPTPRSQTRVTTQRSFYPRLVRRSQIKSAPAFIPLQEHLGGRRPREDVHAAADFAGFASASAPCVSVAKT